MLRWLIILVLGAALGLGSAYLAIRDIGANGAVQVGPWITPLDGGGPARGLYQRATVAVAATLALSRQEAIYFRAATDSLGRPLRGACTYSVHGPELPSRWWSITLYGADNLLIANPQNRYSYASVNVARGPDGGFRLVASPAAQAGDWMNTGAAPRFTLLARLYQPSPAAAADPAKIPLPAIDLVGCP